MEKNSKRHAPLTPDTLTASVDNQLGARGGFLRRYVRWAVTQTDAPETFHVLTGLIGIATVLPQDVRIQMGTDKQDPNLFGMIVGESGRARKSWSMKLITRLLTNVAPDRLGLRLGSYEAMIAQLVEKPYMTVFETEFSRFLSQAKGGGATGGSNYMAGLKTGLTDVYDCTPISRRTMKVKHEVNQYRMNLLAAISDDYLSEYSEPADFTGGFLSRWLFAAGDRTRFLAEPDASPAALAEQGALTEMLRTIYENAPPGKYVFESAAKTMYLDWTEALDQMSAKAEHRLVGLIERAGTLGRRVATMLAADRMVNLEGYRGPVFSPDPVARLVARQSQTSDEVWEIKVSDLDTAMQIVTAHIVAAERIVARVEHTPTARSKAKVLHAMPLNNAVPLGQITRTTGLRKREVIEMLDTLQGEGRVLPVLMNGQQWWARAAEEQARPDTAVELPLPSISAAPTLPPIPLDNVGVVSSTSLSGLGGAEARLDLLKLLAEEERPISMPVYVDPNHRDG